MSSEGRKRDAKAGVKLGATREVSNVNFKFISLALLPDTCIL